MSDGATNADLFGDLDDPRKRWHARREFVVLHKHSDCFCKTVCRSDHFRLKIYEMVKRLQRVAIRLIPGVCELPDETGFVRLKLLSLELGQARGEIIHVYKLINQLSNLSLRRFFKPKGARNRRWHPWMFYKPLARTS